MTQYKLVPVEPTEEMKAAALKKHGYYWPLIFDAWNLMLAAAPEVNPWVSVKERVPKEDGYYLVMNDGCVVAHKHVPIVMRWNLGKWYSHDLSAFYDGVTHWMPIPRPEK